MTRRPTMRAYKKKVCLFLLLLRTVADFIAWSRTTANQTKTEYKRFEWI
jgi:hypothetical protein